jgi:hypothetical protein
MWWPFRRKRGPHHWYIVVVEGDALGTCRSERRCLTCKRYEKMLRGEDMKLYTYEVAEPSVPGKPCSEVDPTP